MDIKKYLQRINYNGPLNPAMEVLSQLQMTHLLHVPFENLDIQNKIKIDLTNLFDKIVNRKRGGFCYELNGLFYDLLTEIGFEVKMVSARVWEEEKAAYSPEFDHMALIVKIESDHYLVDVGFGEFAFFPIKIELNKITEDPRGAFRIESFDENYLAVKKRNAEGIFKPEYIFSEQLRKMDEFYDRCNYHQTNPESHFMQKRICSLPTNSGRITLTNDILKITVDGKKSESKLSDEEDVEKVLDNYFGVKIRKIVTP